MTASSLFVCAKYLAVAAHEARRMEDPEWAGRTKIVYDGKARRQDPAVGGTAGGKAGAAAGGAGGGMDLLFAADFESGNLRKVTQVR